MSRILLSNNIKTRDSVVPAPSIKDDGETYPYRMFFNGNSEIVDADSLAELIDVLIPGYYESDNISQVQKRLDYAQSKILEFRTSVLATLSSDELDELEEWEIDFLTSDKNAVMWESENDIQIWKSDIPILLVDILYAPWTDISRPISKYGDYEKVPNIFWFKISTEKVFLDSLRDLKVIAYGRPSSHNRKIPKRK